MATINATLNITSSDATSEALAISQTTAITVTNPVINTGRESVTTSPTIIVPAEKAATTYLYLKNTDATNSIDLAAAGGASFGTLAPTEWGFFPVKASVGFQATASASTVILEYGYWTQ